MSSALFSQLYILKWPCVSSLLWCCKWLHEMLQVTSWVTTPLNMLETFAWELQRLSLGLFLDYQKSAWIRRKLTLILGSYSPKVQGLVSRGSLSALPLFFLWRNIAFHSFAGSLWSLFPLGICLLSCRSKTVGVCMVVLNMILTMEEKEIENTQVCKKIAAMKEWKRFSKKTRKK